jgi:hypothetical protein
MTIERNQQIQGDSAGQGGIHQVLDQGFVDEMAFL